MKDLVNARARLAFDRALAAQQATQDYGQTVQQSAFQNVQKKPYIPDVSSFMGLCALNYLKLMQLLPNFEEDDVRNFGLPSMDIVSSAHEQHVSLVCISIQERCKYTSMLLLEQRSGSDDRLQSTMEVRLYHDASMAEVMSFQGVGAIQQRSSYSDSAGCEKDEKALCNEFLSDWLSYCLKFGFDLEASPDPGNYSERR